jgi:lysine-N-methylase
MPVKNYLVPDYILKFNCGLCSECCKRWRIIIDKQTVEKYERIAETDKEFSSELKSHLKINKNGQGSITLRNVIKKQDASSGEDKVEEAFIDTLVCPFLTSEGLCSIQKRYGIDALSDTCKAYPRIIALTERGYEMSISYSCKKAAALLKEKKPVEFYSDPEGFEFVDLHGQYLHIGDVMERRKAGRSNYFEIEELLIDIMQLREMDIDTRIILTGILIDKIKDGDSTGIGRYLQNLDRELFNKLKSIPSQPTFMMKLIKEIVDKRLMFNVIEKDMQLILTYAYNRLQLLNENVISDEKVQKFLAGYNQLYKTGLPDISHVYENFFVNFIFSKKFYTHKYIDAYFLLMFFFILIRFFTVCKCMAEEKQVDEDMLVEVISAIERSIGHNPTYYEGILKMVKEGNYHRLHYVISLINL